MFVSVAKSNLKASLKQSQQFNFVRFQSTKPANVNLLKSNLSTKVSKNKDIKKECNALSNQNLVSQEDKSTQQPLTATSSQKSKSLNKTSSPKTKKDYKCPRVPNTSYLDPEYVAIDALYAGYRPLAMKGLKKDLVPARSWYTNRRDPSYWSISATGLESFGDWDELPYNEFTNMFPLRPPTSTKVLRKSYKDAEKITKKDNLVYGFVDSQNNSAIPERQHQPKIKVRRGRVKPSAIRLLHKKK